MVIGSVAKRSETSSPEGLSSNPGRRKGVKALLAMLNKLLEWLNGLKVATEQFNCCTEDLSSNPCQGTNIECIMKQYHKKKRGTVKPNCRCGPEDVGSNPCPRKNFNV